MDALTDIKKEFPMLAAQPELSYLDSAASSQTPVSVLDAMDAYYRTCRANVHRGMYAASEAATAAYEAARADMARFLVADTDEIVFTRGTTDAMNLLARSLGDTLGAGDEVVLSAMEHHAVIVPWQQAAARRGFTLKVIPLGADFELDMDAARELIGARTKVVTVVWASNVLGTVNPVRELIAIARAHGAITILDAAQAAGHLPIDVRAIDCDFLALSGHKMFGPTGIGVLYGKKERLDAMEPVAFGGDMIREVTWERSVWQAPPLKFEAGTPPIAEAIGLGAAVRFLERFDLAALSAHETALAEECADRLAALGYVKVLGPAKGRPRIGVVSFAIDGVHPHDAVTLLDRSNVACRGGHHCAMPLIRALGVNGTVRASFSIYSTPADIDALIRAIQAARKVFGYDA